MARLSSLFVGAAFAAALAPQAVSADIWISSDATQNISCSGGVCTPSAKRSVLNASELSALLGSGNVTVLGRYGDKHKSAGTIMVVAPVSWSNASALTLSSTVFVDAPVTILGTGALATSGTLRLGFNASITFWDVNSTLSIANVPYTMVGDLPTLAADIAQAQGKGNYALANTYDAIGDTFSKPPITDFSGSFTGLGHGIANLNLGVGRKGCMGLFAQNHGELRDIRLQSVSVSSATQKNVGALAGCNHSSIYNVGVDGSVSGSPTGNAGGIVGLNQGTISLARSSAMVSGGQVGGVAGENDDTLYRTYADGSVSGQSNAGGLVGANKSQITESYATAAVNGSAGTVGGFAGFNGGQIYDSYSIGTVAGTGTVGGFIGYDPLESVSNGYWDLETSGVSDPNQGAGFPRDDASIRGLTTVQLQNRLQPGFSRKLWHLDPNINGGFPYLRDAPPQ